MPELLSGKEDGMFLVRRGPSGQALSTEDIVSVHIFHDGRSCNIPSSEYSSVNGTMLQKEILKCAFDKLGVRPQLTPRARSVTVQRLVWGAGGGGLGGGWWSKAWCGQAVADPAHVCWCVPMSQADLQNPQTHYDLVFNQLDNSSPHRKYVKAVALAVV